MAGSKRAVALLRGINLGPNRRVAMPALREALTDAGFSGVRTYVQSGNLVLSGKGSPQSVARRIEELIAEHFDLDVPVVVRTRDELAEVVARDPLSDVVDNPKRYQVTFLESEPPAGTVERLEGLAARGERLVASGRELYCWHPEGIARSKLAAALADRRVGGTARNWTTVTTLLAMADEE
jgi:uncharacterized protein (DUF1697 family)